jgi:hypothetical protein
MLYMREREGERQRSLNIVLGIHYMPFFIHEKQLTIEYINSDVMQYGILYNAI